MSGTYRMAGKQLVDAAERIPTRAPEPTRFARAASLAQRWAENVALAVFCLFVVLVSGGAATLWLYSIFIATGAPVLSWTFAGYGAFGVGLAWAQFYALYLLWRSDQPQKRTAERGDATAFHADILA